MAASDEAEGDADVAVPGGAADGSAEVRMEAARAILAEGLFAEAAKAFEELLSEVADQANLLTDAHLALAECHRGLGDIKAALECCHSAVAAHTASVHKRKAAFEARSECMRALRTFFAESDGDSSDNIRRDRAEAVIVVDPCWNNNCSTDSSHQKVVPSLSEALHASKEGDKIFVEAGQHEVSSLFLCKTVSLIGASTRHCVLVYTAAPLHLDDPTRLNTLLVCTERSSSRPTLIKRLTLRSSGEGGRTRFLGVAGGSLQIEDVVFDAADDGEVDALYTNARICGDMADHFPSPDILVRYCVFDRCRSFAAVSVLQAAVVRIQSCFFVGSRLAAMEGGRLVAADCHFERADVPVLAVGAEISLQGCCFSATNLNINRNSTAALKGSLFDACGVDCVASDFTCTDNVFLFDRDRRARGSADLALGVCLREKSSKLQVSGNLFVGCDVGVRAGDGAVPTLRANTFEKCMAAALVLEGRARPNVIGNVFLGGNLDAGVPVGNCVPGGLGVLLVQGAGGLLGRNVFRDFDVAPIMVFTSCRPMAKDNVFESVGVTRERQASAEDRIKAMLNADLFENESHFYVIDSEEMEKEWCQMMLKEAKELPKDS